ncbi:MAG: methyltransferase domain-containing protein [Pseudomonadota bacterium]
MTAGIEKERSVQQMYEYSPYPDLGANLKTMELYLNPIKTHLKNEMSFLDIGCGTGHCVISVAKDHPSWTCKAIDLSDPSLKIAQNLAKMHNVKNIDFYQGSYVEALPWDEKFDIISAIGTVHHCSNPLKAMINLRKYLKDDGYMFLHMYGARCDKGKFDIKEMLSILEPDLKNHEKRFMFYLDLMDHKNNKILKRILTTSPYDCYVYIRNKIRNFNRKIKNESFSPSWEEDYKVLSSPWIDHFCHPQERAYEVHEIRELLEQSKFKVVHMLKQGKENLSIIPKGWYERYHKLDEWDQYRLSELLSIGGSFAMILQKADK